MMWIGGGVCDMWVCEVCGCVCGGGWWGCVCEVGPNEYDIGGVYNVHAITKDCTLLIVLQITIFCCRELYMY